MSCSIVVLFVGGVVVAVASVAIVDATVVAAVSCVLLVDDVVDGGVAAQSPKVIAIVPQVKGPKRNNQQGSHTHNRVYVCWPTTNKQGCKLS